MKSIKVFEAYFYWYAEQCIEGGYIVTINERKALRGILQAFIEGKSIMIFGGNGTGKTLLFELLKRIVHPKSGLKFRSRNVLDTVLDFNTRGHECFRDDQKSSVFYDDLGSEDRGYWYGDKVEVFEKLIQFRYDNWRSNNLRTFFTSNLTLDELLTKYGSRCRYRIKEQYYQVVLNGESKRNLKNFKGFAPINHKTILSKEDAEWNAYYEAHKKQRQNMPVQEIKGGIGSQLKKQWEDLNKDKHEATRI